MFTSKSLDARQRGAASLIVVMVLFFVVSMVAAYTNRNLIFEQKTAANQQRSTRALEVADAGLDWALTMLNTGRITADCNTSTSAADTDFRQRYLSIDPANGNIIPVKRTDVVPTPPLEPLDLHPTCVYNGSSWTCSCPVNSAPTVTAPTGSDIYPAFRVRFRRLCGLPTLRDGQCPAPGTPDQPGVIHIDVNGCTTLSEDCLRFETDVAGSAPKGLTGEGRATVHMVAALRSGLGSAPTAAFIARGTVTLGASTFGASNSEVEGSGIAVQTGQAFVPSPSVRLQGKAGTPPSQAVFDSDAKLAALVDLSGPPARTAKDLFFANTFGIWSSTFRDQPAAIDVDCTGGCSAASLRTTISLNPGRVFWVRGDLDFDSAGDIGSASQPVLLNVTGSVTFSSDVNVYGLVYSQADTWTASGAGTVFGAAIAETNFDGSAASTSIVYNSSILTRLRTITGSFVRVPGTWRDFDS